MKDGLKDIIKHTKDLGFVEQVRIDSGPGKAADGTEGPAETTVFAKEVDAMVIVNAKFHKAWPDLQGTIGISELGLFKWALTSDMFDGDGSSVTVIKDTDKATGEEYLAEFEFNGRDGNPWRHRFMHPAVVKKHLEVFQPNVTEWNITFNPSQERIRNFASAAAAIKDYESNFSFELQDGQLLADFGGDRGSHRGKVVFADSVTGNFDKKFRWSIPKLLQVLRLAEDSANSEIRLMNNDKDAIMVVSVDSGLAKWEYAMTPLA